MRKLVWFSLGFGAACCLCAYVLTGSVRVILTVAGGVLTLLTAIAGRKYIWFRRVAAIFLGFAAGMGWFTLYDGFYLSAVGTMDGKTADAVIRVSDYSYERHTVSAWTARCSWKENPTAFGRIWIWTNLWNPGT